MLWTMWNVRLRATPKLADKLALKGLSMGTTGGCSTPKCFEVCIRNASPSTRYSVGTTKSPRFWPATPKPFATWALFLDLKHEMSAMVMPCGNCSAATGEPKPEPLPTYSSASISYWWCFFNLKLEYWLLPCEPKLQSFWMPASF